MGGARSESLGSDRQDYGQAVSRGGRTLARVPANHRRALIRAGERRELRRGGPEAVRAITASGQESCAPDWLGARDSSLGERIGRSRLRPAGGGGENRTRVRSSVPQDLYERSPGFASHLPDSRGTGSGQASRGIESPRRPRRPLGASQRSLRRTPLLLTESGPAPGINPRLTTLLTQRKPVRDWRL